MGTWLEGGGAYRLVAMVVDATICQAMLFRGRDHFDRLQPPSALPSFFFRPLFLSFSSLSLDIG